MTFCIITHVPHSKSGAEYFAYAPYVNEMNIWLRHTDQVIIVAPLKNITKTAIHQNYNHSNIEFIAVPEFSLLGFKEICKTILELPKITFLIFKAMNKSSHVHLRCPGNMGLLGSFVQVLFPKKKKTAKYAGNWDGDAKQPFSYKIQKYILSNPFLTRNMQVLVYGDWKNQSKNIKSFFTATYSEIEKVEIAPKKLNEVIKCIFVGTLTSGKQPILAIKIVEELLKRKHKVQLEIYGDGIEKSNLEKYIHENNLSDVISILGNIPKENLKNIYKQSHFLILASKSEGWPKVVAEAMFWGCLPIATPVSCLNDMLDYGNRGVIISSDFSKTISEIETIIFDENLYFSKINAAINWSRLFTIDKFEDEIKKLIKE